MSSRLRASLGCEPKDHQLPQEDAPHNLGECVRARHLGVIQRMCEASARIRFRYADLNEAALRRTHSRVAEPTVEVI